MATIRHRPWLLATAPKRARIFDNGSNKNQKDILAAAEQNLNRYMDEQFEMLTAATGPDFVTFPPLNWEQRKRVHHAAQQYGLSTAFMGEGDMRRLTVYRPGAKDVPARDTMYSEMPREEQLSRKLTAVLRHRAVEEGLEITEEGYVRLSDVLALDMFRNVGFSASEVESLATKTDQKQRFLLVEWGGEVWIRANQGHTIRLIQDTKLLKPIKSPYEVPCCVHGTYLFAWKQILRSGGLSRMTRNHIHFAPEAPGVANVISGLRGDCEVAIYISVIDAMDAGIEFFRSANNVILTCGDEGGMLPMEFFVKVVRLSDNEPLIFNSHIKASPGGA